MKTLSEHLNENFSDKSVMISESDQKDLDMLHQWFADYYGQKSTGQLPMESIDFAHKTVNCVYQRGQKKKNFTIWAVNTDITQLLPNGWKFGRIDDNFDISGCTKIKDLSLAPESIGKMLRLDGCTGLTSFKGNVKEVGASVWCKNCINLKSWEGAPAIGGKWQLKGSGLEGTEPGANPSASSKPVSNEPEMNNLDPKDFKTLYDCIKDNIKNFAFERSLGPSHYSDIKYIAKEVKSKFKADPLLTTTGKKGNPAMLSDIVAGIATQIEIDWKLKPEDRIDDAFKQFRKILNDVKKDYEPLESKLYVDFEVDPVIKKYIRGTKSFSAKKGVGMSIFVMYKSGELTVNVDDNCALFKNID